MIYIQPQHKILIKHITSSLSEKKKSKTVYEHKTRWRPEGQLSDFYFFFSIFFHPNIEEAMQTLVATVPAGSEFINE